jgi:hypothetical protein
LRADKINRLPPARIKNFQEIRKIKKLGIAYHDRVTPNLTAFQEIDLGSAWETGNNSMAGIKWNSGRPPESQRGKRLLLIASPTGVNFDLAADNRPDIYIGHFGEAEGDYVPARIWGMSENEGRHGLQIRYWAEIDLPPGVELRELTVSDLKG